jgi:hypothetical protein
MRRHAPVLVLFLLSPLVAEVLFGATPLSRLGSLVAVAPLYGGGAVLIRELARRRGRGWWRIALLGAAYGLIEEGLAIQSLFNPDLFNAAMVGGRAFGVNWIWTEWTIGYHVVWSVCIPILLAELLFPRRKAEPWIGTTGMLVAGSLFALGTLAVGAIFRLAVAPNFRTPLPLLGAAVMLVAGLVTLALGWPADLGRRETPGPKRPAPSPWFVGLVALAAGLAWFNLLNLPQVLRTGPLALVPLLLGCLVATTLVGLIRRWTTEGREWTSLHALALVGGALVPSTLVGIFFVTAGDRVDQMGQVVVAVIALLLLTTFAVRLRTRTCAAPDRVHAEAARRLAADDRPGSADRVRIVDAVATVADTEHGPPGS